MIDAMKKGVEMRMMREHMEAERQRLRMEQEIHDQRMRQLRMQDQAIQEQTTQNKRKREQEDQLRRMREETNRIKTEAAIARAEAMKSEIEAAFRALSARYPDFEENSERMTRAAELIRPADGADISVVQYLEALYVVAKHTKIVETTVKP